MSHSLMTSSSQQHGGQEGSPHSTTDSPTGRVYKRRLHYLDKYGDGHCVQDIINCWSAPNATNARDPTPRSCHKYFPERQLLLTSPYPHIFHLHTTPFTQQQSMPSTNVHPTHFTSTLHPPKTQLHPKPTKHSSPLPYQ